MTGSHNYTFGYNQRVVKIDHFIGTEARAGNFSFDGTHSGHAIADMLLGYPRTSTITADNSNFRSHQRGRAYSFFFNDDWKASANLTLNFGLRYEFNTPMFDTEDAIHSFNFDTGKIAVPFPEKLSPTLLDPKFVEQSSNGRALRKADYNNFSPRIGIAYTLNNKTVVRSGYGMFTDNIAFGNHQTRFVQQSPWYKTVQFLTDSVTGPAISLKNDPFPARIFTEPLLSLLGWDKDFRDGYMQNWNVSIQRELVQGMMLETAYMGSKGSHLILGYNANQAFLPGGSLGSGSIQSRRPYPSFATITRMTSGGRSNFHSLQVKLERRFTNGLSFLGNYLWSKALDNGSVGSPTGDRIQDARNLSVEYGPSAFDARHRFVTSFVYELPLGSGRRFIQQGALSHVLGGWQISGIATLQAGRPEMAILAGDNSNTAGSTDRPNVVGNPNTGKKTVDNFWNKDALVVPARGTFGNAGRNILVGPGMQGLDMALMKHFYLGSERDRRIQFRAEAFNILNHPIFGQPNGSFNTTNFGVIQSTLVNTTSRQIQLAIKIFF
jgi:hypothetical protein